MYTAEFEPFSFMVKNMWYALVNFQRLSNGSIEPDSDVTRVLELQETVEKQNTELTSSRTRVLELTNRCTELEESLGTAQKDLSKAQEQLAKLQRDLREVRPNVCFIGASKTKNACKMETVHESIVLDDLHLSYVSL